MTNSENAGWVALSALGAAMFAIGVSVASVACSTAHDGSVGVGARPAATAQSSAGNVVVPGAGNGAALPTSALPSAPSAASTPSGANAAVTNAPSATTTITNANDARLTSADPSLKLKRVVVTRKIEHREPTLGDGFTLGDAPVYAFVELENSGRAPRDIRVLFENQDTQASVGHVKLTIPAAQPRFRTWGNTRLIRDPGHWVAVVTTSDGVELGRAPFDVKG